MRYLIRRLGFYLVTAWAAITLNFLIPRLMPGNPVELLISHFKGRISPAAMKSLTVLFGLNHQSMLSQYWSYWNNLLHGNLGVSFTYFPTPVIQVIMSALPWTAVLVGTSTVLSFIIGTVAGIVRRIETRVLARSQPADHALSSRRSRISGSPSSSCTCSRWWSSGSPCPGATRQATRSDGIRNSCSRRWIMPFCPPSRLSPLR